MQLIGKMTLNRNPTNYFAETEQVAFHTGNLVPGIEATNDPLMQARLFSYLDTQLTRLGGPNFTQLPINRPHCPVNDMLRDGMHQTAVHDGISPYLPNGIDESPRVATAREGAYVQTPRRPRGRPSFEGLPPPSTTTTHRPRSSTGVSPLLSRPMSSRRSLSSSARSTKRRSRSGHWRYWLTLIRTCAARWQPDSACEPPRAPPRRMWMSRRPSPRSLTCRARSMAAKSGSLPTKRATWPASRSCVGRCRIWVPNFSSSRRSEERWVAAPTACPSTGPCSPAAPSNSTPIVVAGEVEVNQRHQAGRPAPRGVPPLQGRGRVGHAGPPYWRMSGFPSTDRASSRAGQSRRTFTDELVAAIGLHRAWARADAVMASAVPPA